VQGPGSGEASGDLGRASAVPTAEETGVHEQREELVDADPVGAMFGPSTWPQFVHMVLAAYMVTGYLVASVYAAGMLRGRRGLYHRFGLIIPLTAGFLRWR